MFVIIPVQVLKARVLALLGQRDPRRLRDRPRARTSFPSPLCALRPAGPSQWRVGSDLANEDVVEVKEGSEGA